MLSRVEAYVGTDTRKSFLAHQIRISDCDGGIDNRVMTIGDRREGRIFLSQPHTNNGFFFLLTT